MNTDVFLLLSLNNVLEISTPQLNLFVAILFGGVCIFLCQWNCFLYFLLNYSLLVYRNTTDICVLFLLISTCKFAEFAYQLQQLSSLAIDIYRIMTFANRDSFYFFLSNLFALYLFFLSICSSQTFQYGVGKQKEAFLSWSCSQGANFQSFTTEYDVSCGFL